MAAKKGMTSTTKKNAPETLREKVKDHPIFLVIGAITSLITIFVFLTGKTDLPSFFARPTSIQTSQPTTTNLPTATVSAFGPSKYKDGLAKVQAATIRVVSTTTLLDPTSVVGIPTSTSSSGFIIHSDGIAITSFHGVAGAKLIEVFVPGEDNPRNARVLGGAQCIDLAVIDIDGSNFPFLEWYEGKLKIGKTVFAAGYPVDQPQLALSEGIISKIQTEGEMPFASVDRVIMHTAKLNPGSSGGPLLTEDSRVIGINLGGNSESGQYISVDAYDSQEIIETLKSGLSYAPIGVNGMATKTQGDTLSGIWVFSVEKGSSADKLGIKPGDMITKLGGLDLAKDGTMSIYCGVLRTYNGDSPLDITVVRIDEGTVLEGQIDGDALKVVGSFQSK